MFQKQKTKKRRTKYVYPRTVEAAKDPFHDASGKNKMFYVIAVNLFPDSKIIQPSDSESDTDEDEVNREEKSEWITQDVPKSFSYAKFPKRSQVALSKALRRRHVPVRPHRVSHKKIYDRDTAGVHPPRIPIRLVGPKKSDTPSVPRPRAPVRRPRNRVNHSNAAASSRSVVDAETMFDAINSVAGTYSRNSRLNSSAETSDANPKTSDGSFEIEKEM